MSNYIFKYSRADALRDGVLVDITKYAKEMGFKYPVAVTDSVFGILNPSDELKDEGQDLIGRIWDLLIILKWQARKLQDKSSDRVNLSPLFVMRKGKSAEPIDMWCHCGPGDNFEPVLTVMLIGED